MRAWMAVGAVVLLALSGLSLAAPARAGAPSPAAAPLSGSGCAGPAVPASYGARLAVDGTALPLPSVANRTVTVSFQVELNYTPRLTGVSQYSCTTGVASATTDAAGNFSVALTLPTSSCNAYSCSSYTGPFGPANFSVAPVPPGYFVRANASGSGLKIALVQALASATTDPPARVTLSENAPTLVTAAGWAGDGSPSPAALADAWSLTGSHWLLLGNASGPTVTIEAEAGATPGLLAVNVSGTFNGSSLPAVGARLDLASAPTVATDGSLSGTAVDAGTPLAFSVSGTGAYGYAYSALLAPGLGAATVTAPCVATPIAGGEVSLACPGSVTYASSGTAQPVATLTNGFSSATWTFPDVAVAAALDVLVAPDPLVAYVGASTALTVRAAGGTGTAPVGPACVWPGDGSLACATGAGGSFSFPLAYAAAGVYDGRASLADAGGGNASAPFLAQIFLRPSLAPIVATGNRVSAGGNVTFSSSVTGGALPLAYWWNTSSPAGTLYAGTLGRDGSIVLTLRPTLAGATNVTLTLVDALGTRVAVRTPLVVTAGPAVALGPPGPSGPWTAVAGTPFAVTWAALDPFGEVVGNFSAPVTLTVLLPGGGAAPVWINSSLAGPVAAGPGGSFVLPPSDWQRGYLNFTLDVGRAGAVGLAVGAPIPVVGATAGLLGLAVTADLRHLALSAPSVTLPGSRSNDTLWRISDRFGDAVPGGFVVVRAVFGAVTALWQSPILVNGSESRVWVNFSAPAATAGTVFVVSEWNQSLLSPIDVPAEAAAAPPLGWVLAGFAASALGAVGYAVLRRRRGPVPGPSAAPDGGPAGTAGSPGDVEEELRRLAEGRAHVLARADPGSPRTLDELVDGFPGAPPTPEEVTDWVSSLVAEGSLSAKVGRDGRPRFVRVSDGPAAAGRAGAGPPRIELDDRALDEALRRRADGEDPPAGDAPSR